MSEPRPDPYPTPAATATPRRPTQTQTPVANVVRTSVARTPVHRSSVVPRKPRQAVKQNAAVKPIRLPTHPAPGLGARFAAAVVFEPQQRVSRTLALAVALLVLLSAAFVAGAAREVAR